MNNMIPHEEYGRRPGIAATGAPVPAPNNAKNAPRACRTLRVALIGNVPPQPCGIATFTGDLIAASAAHTPHIEYDVFPLLDAPSAEPKAIVRGTRQSYHGAAQLIGETAYDAVWIQHEYGIFGGPSGEYICDLVEAVAPPLVLTLHTILERPSANEERILRRLVSRASRIMVMSEHGRDLLASRYGAPHELIDVIEHGAPDRPFGRTQDKKRELGLADRKVLMTFGLLGPGKGLEHAISALPSIVERHPDVIYRIVGATHPKLVEREGEAYREKLQALADRFEVAGHIDWVNEFLDTEQLLDQLETCDIYLTPYLNLQQATSGTLSYAVALGKAVVSTPYVHARELLGAGVGRLVEPENFESIADAVCDLLSSEEGLAEMQERAWKRGRQTIWSQFARNTADMLARAAAPAASVSRPSRVRIDPVLHMSDGVGILQHGRFVVADRAHGYCLDDNARALMLANSLGALGDNRLEREQLTYAAFVQDAWDGQRGRFRNFMSFSRNWLESEGSDDSNGRGFWALGHTIARSVDPMLRRWAVALYDDVLPHVGKMESPRAIAFTMLGAGDRLDIHPNHRESLALLREGAETLSWLLAEARRPAWRWFEAVLGYDNPRLAQALLVAGERLGEARFVAAGLETLRWISQRQMSPAGYFAPIGSESFGREHQQLPFDQQPLEAQAQIEASCAAKRLDPDGDWGKQAKRAWDWFFGKNDRGIVLVDETTGRCFDGITPRGRNENSGAESILAFLLAQTAMLTLTAQQGSERKRGDKTMAQLPTP
jgi:glycosyltransferase involved in cell wall biosynthesis